MVVVDVLVEVLVDVVDVLVDVVEVLVDVVEVLVDDLGFVVSGAVVRGVEVVAGTVLVERFRRDEAPLGVSSSSRSIVVEVLDRDVPEPELLGSPGTVVDVGLDSTDGTVVGGVVDPIGADGVPESVVDAGPTLEVGGVGAVGGVRAIGVAGATGAVVGDAVTLVTLGAVTEGLAAMPLAWSFGVISSSSRTARTPGMDPIVSRLPLDVVIASALMSSRVRSTCAPRSRRTSRTAEMRVGETATISRSLFDSVGRSDWSI